MNQIEYMNNTLVRLEELLFHELSGCAHWKVELVGVDFIRSRNVQGRSPEEVIENCIKEIVGAGMVKEMDYSIGGQGIKLELSVKGCLHLPKEMKLRKEGITPYCCPITNMIQDQLIEKLPYATCYLAELHIEENTGRCSTRSAIYEDEGKIGCVCNWNEE
jgi:hypothetical protein